MDEQTKLLVKKVTIDVICLAAVGFPILYFYLFGEPFRRGFFCEDLTIRYPFKDSTVTNVVLYIVGLGLPIIVMALLELVNCQRTRNHTIHSAFGVRIHPWLWRCYCVIGVFGFGAACSQLTTDFGKYIIGRLRPHFLDVCQPNVDCTLEKNKYRYITDFTCINEYKENKARLSFPSGHSSFSFYCMLYLVIYLQKNFSWGGSRLLKPFIQFILLSMAIGTALSRVSNNKHHWSDVLAGSFLGISVALIVSYFVSDFYESKRKIPKNGIDKDLKDNGSEGHVLNSKDISGNDAHNN